MRTEAARFLMDLPVSEDSDDGDDQEYEVNQTVHLATFLVVRPSLVMKKHENSSVHLLPHHSLSLLAGSHSSCSPLRMPQLMNWRSARSVHVSYYTFDVPLAE